MDDQVRALSVLALFLRFRKHHGEAAARVTKLRSSSVSTTMRLTPQLFMRTFLIFEEDLAKKKACDERCSLPCLTTAIKHANNSSSGISREIITAQPQVVNDRIVFDSVRHVRRSN